MSTGPPNTEPPSPDPKIVPTLLKWTLGVLAVFIAIGLATSENKPDLEANAPAGAKAGSWDGECEAGFLNECDEEGARDNLKPVEIHCRWRGSEVVVHVKLDSTFNARLEVGVVPRYVIEDGGQHGTASGSEETKVVEPQASVIFDINAGKPKGVPVGTAISECKPKLYNVALENDEAA